MSQCPPMDGSPESKNHLFPVFLKLGELQTLVVGGGNVALEKVNALLGNCPEARVTVVAARVDERITSLTKRYPSLVIKDRNFRARDLYGQSILILATDDHKLHQRICRLARNRRLLVNVADTPALCDFYLGSVVTRGNLKIGISTNGMSPTMAKRIREFFDEILPETIDELLEKLHQIRETIKGNFREKVDTLNTITSSWLSKPGNDRQV